MVKAMVDTMAKPPSSVATVDNGKDHEKSACCRSFLIHAAPLATAAT